MTGRHVRKQTAVLRPSCAGPPAPPVAVVVAALRQQQRERVVGQKLVDRPGGPKRVSLTEAGRLLLRHADAIVAQLDAAQADMAALAQGEAGPLRIGIYQSVGVHLLPALLRRFREEWPR